MTCSFEGCKEPVVARWVNGHMMCKKHYILAAYELMWTDPEFAERNN